MWKRMLVIMKGGLDRLALQDSIELMHVQVSDPAYTKYGAAVQSVPLNGCASISAKFNAYTGQASAGAAPKSSKKVSTGHRTCARQTLRLMILYITWPR